PRGGPGAPDSPSWRHGLWRTASTTTTYSSSLPAACPGHSADRGTRYIRSFPQCHTRAFSPPGQRNRGSDSANGRVETAPHDRQRSAERHSRPARGLPASDCTEWGGYDGDGEAVAHKLYGCVHHHLRFLR